MELDHVSHPDHKLSYRKSVKRNEKPRNCAACRDDIYSKHYCCSECDFFLHKLCAERPLELEHSLHPLHPLHLLHKSPSADGSTRCSACTIVLSEGFIYRCAICEFDLDFICAFPDGLKLNHVSHPEHVLTFEKAVKRSDQRLICVACLDEISGQSAEHYSCRRCNVFLHKVCSEAPLEVTHSEHIHPLRIVMGNPFSNEDASCDVCDDKLEGLLYHCNLCNEFAVHITCAGSDWKLDYSAFPGGIKLDHFCHPHILTLETEVKSSDEGQVRCAVCRGGIYGPLADYYSCRQCDFFLHQVCGERPRELIHYLYPEHTLNLLKRDRYGREPSSCCSCQNGMDGFVYHCQCNQFINDLNCAFPFNLEKRIQNHEELHHHPLIFFPSASKISCDFCSSAPGDEGEKEQSYACSTCDFMIHRSCALMEFARKYKEHEHPLSLVVGVPEDLQNYPFFCYVCHYRITPEDLVAHCARCRFFVHVSCMIIEETDDLLGVKDDVDYLYDSLIQIVLSEDFGSEFVRYPQKDVSSELIQPFLLGGNGIVMNAQPKIRHSSHEEHDMVLFEELSVNTDSFFKEEDEEILCDACIHPISAPYYCCQDCNYYLHLPCANLPQKFHHFGHAHELDLTYRLRFFYNYNCGRCGNNCNGFSYWCEICNFHIDLTCAALPAFIMHESHEHLLFQPKQQHEGLCYCCNRDVGYDDQIFMCRSCDVYLHYNCALHPRSIRHRWDREHPLDLRCPPHGDHPDHFMCDMCEEIIHPMRWLYSCFKCEVSFHTGCAPKYQTHPNVKYGGKVKISSHPHILKHLAKATLKINCDKCEDQLYHQDVFECETCFYCICSKCMFQEEHDSKLRITEA